MNDISKLDVELVAKIAETELDYLSELRWDDGDDEEGTSALARKYLKRYLKSNFIFGVVVEQALSELAESELYTVAGRPWTPEFAAGHALAVAARNHAVADLALLDERFFVRSTSETLPERGYLLSLAGAVCDDRLEGVNMERSYRSVRECTPQMVLDYARNMGGELNGRWRNAAELITHAECDEMAERLMQSDCEWSSDDDSSYNDLDCCIADRLEELGCEDVLYESVL